MLSILCILNNPTSSPLPPSTLHLVAIWAVIIASNQTICNNLKYIYFVISIKISILDENCFYSYGYARLPAWLWEVGRGTWLGYAHVSTGKPYIVEDLLNNIVSNIFPFPGGTQFSPITDGFEYILKIGLIKNFKWLSNLNLYKINLQLWGLILI